MRIERVECIKVLVPIKPELAIRSSAGLHAASPFLIVRVHTDEGIMGLGEASCTPAWSGEDHHTAAHFIDGTLGPALVGRDPRDVEALARMLDRLVPGNDFTKSALQMALWDILGKAAGLPLYRLWGGAVRERIPLKFSVSGREPEAAAGIGAWAVGQGFRTLKVKVGTGVDADVERVRAVRQAAGPGIRLGVDANCGWSVREAIAALRAMEPLDLLFAEQPVPREDPAWMAEVRRATGVPLIADESVFNLQDAMAIVRAGAADVFSVYAGKGGGLIGARKIAAVAEAAGLTCTVGSNLELGVASAAMIHLALSTPGIEPEAFPCDIIGPYYYEEDLLTTPLPLRDGAAGAVNGPGLGVELDEAAVARYRVN
jgi:muconate cycloisomerase